MGRLPGWGIVGWWLRAFAVALVLTALAVPLLRAVDRVGPTSAAALARADRLYAQKSYAGALAAYERLLQADDVPAGRRDEVQYRVGVALGKTAQWDRALEQSLAFVKTHRGTVWEPRGLYWLGRLYRAVPHEVWPTWSCGTRRWRSS